MVVCHIGHSMYNLSLVRSPWLVAYVMCCSSFFFFSSRRRHTRCSRDWSSDVCSSDLLRERRKKIFLGGDSREFVFTRLGRRLRNVRTGFEKARERAGLEEDVTFHTLRHTFASWFVANGGGPYRLPQYLRHSPITLTRPHAPLGQKDTRGCGAFFS